MAGVPSAPAKAELRTENNEVIPLLFNPAELTMTKAASWNAAENKGGAEAGWTTADDDHVEHAGRLPPAPLLCAREGRRADQRYTLRPRPPTAPNSSGSARRRRVR